MMGCIFCMETRSKAGGVCADLQTTLLGLRKPGARSLRRGSFFYRNKEKFVAFPISNFQALWSAPIHRIRSSSLGGKYEIATMKETFGVQVFLIVLGYLIITRLNMALRRREDAGQGVSFMIENWSDAHSTFVSFIHAAQTKKLSAEKKANLRTAYELITHYFSLMHAIALISLKESESHPYGRISDEGAEAIQKLRPLEEAQLLSQMMSSKTGKRATQLELLNDEIENISSKDLKV